MLHLLEFLTSFYWILIPQFIVESLFRARLRDAYDSGGPLGMVKEGIGSTIGLNSAIFYVHINGRWSGRRIRKLLALYEIPMWGWGYAFQQYYFHVHREDWALAREVMLQAGVEMIEY